ncbi:MAG: 16S rRNA (guanine(527)-N(7))-methyltransferase RsmG [Armatimonadota bacterium]|nr:16S rRNA (guanine(527)-N(7))-methyltransferase RsmG [Armatimonadota bacterium]
MGLEVTATAAERFDRYLNELVRWRARLNLTAVRTAREIVRRHFLDSILAAAAVPMRIGASTVDVGSGAGFPGIPVKIVRPDLEVVLVESSRRRVAFLEHLAQVLDMPGLRVVWGRAEELAHRQAYREAFDYAVERATSRPAVSVELCLPFVRVGGAAVLLKASCAAEDIRQRYELVRALGGDVDTAALEESMGLPGGDRRRIAIVLKKVGQTPERFPRRAHRIGREP